MNVGSAVATWLKGLRLLYDDECEEATGDSSRVTLSQSATAYFANGVRVALLLRALSHDGDLSLDTIKELHTPVARLYNWNVLIPILATMGVDVDADMKVLIVAGDLDIVADVLEQLHGSGTGSGPARRQGGQGMQQPRAANETTSVAQLLAFCCSEQLGCSWDQAVELARSPGHKALAKQQGLGVRGEHSAAVRWFKLVFAHCKHLGALCAGDASEALTPTLALTLTLTLTRTRTRTRTLTLILTRRSSRSRRCAAALAPSLRTWSSGAAGCSAGSRPTSRTGARRRTRSGRSSRGRTAARRCCSTHGG